MRIKRFKTKKEETQKRHIRVRAKVSGTADKPRLSVFRSNRHIFAQLIDDVSGKTVASASDAEIKAGKKGEGFVKVDVSKAVGAALAKKASEKKVKEVVFDRGGFRYAGRVKALAEGAREGGLEF